MDIELLQQALENDTNLNIINTNIQEIKQKKNEVLQELGLSGSASPEDVASGILKVMIKTKLSKKPMLGQDRGYVLNVNVNGLGDFVEVSNEKIDALDTEALLNNIAVAASEMKMNFDALFKD